MLHFAYSKVTEGEKGETVMQQLKQIAENAHYRMKLQLTVILAGVRLSMQGEQPSAEAVGRAIADMLIVNGALRKHYKARLDALNGEIPTKQTFTDEKMTFQ